MIKTISWITVAITLFSSQLTAQEMLGYTIHAPPLNFVLTPKQGEPGEPEITGFTTDVIKEIFHRTRDIVNIEIIPWHALIVTRKPSTIISFLVLPEPLNVKRNLNG